VSADIEEMETELQASDSGQSNEAGVAVPQEEAECLNRKDGEAGKKHEEEKFTMSRLLHSRQLRLPLFIAMFLQVIQQLSGINAVMIFSVSLPTPYSVSHRMSRAVSNIYVAVCLFTIFL